MNKPRLEANAGLIFNREKISILLCFWRISKFVHMLNIKNWKVLVHQTIVLLFLVFSVPVSRKTLDYFSIFSGKVRNGKFGLQHGKGPRTSLDKSAFKLRWHQASDHRAFNNTENVWANSCHGLPEQSDRLHIWRGSLHKRIFLLLEIDANENMMGFNKQQSQPPLLNVIAMSHKQITCLFLWERQ